MARNKSNRAEKIEQREKAKKKAKQKKLLKICVGILIAVALSVFAVYMISQTDSDSNNVHTHSAGCRH